MRHQSQAIATAFDEDSQIILGPLDTLMGYHLRRAYLEVSSDFADTFAGTAMRQVLFGVMSVISANPGINQGQVGKVLGIQRTNMVALVNQLVERGLVSRQLARTDRRAFSLSLTEEGQRTLQDALETIRSHEEKMLSELSGRERTMLVALLRKIQLKGA